MEKQTLHILVSTGQAKELLGKNITDKQLNEMDEEEIEAYYKIYELNYSNKVSNSLNNTIFSLYSYAINKVVEIDDIEKLQEDLNSSYILSHELRNISGGIARFSGKLWSLLELSLTTLKHIRFNKRETSTEPMKYLEEPAEELEQVLE